MGLWPRRSAVALHSVLRRFHVGSGQKPLSGWINVDIQRLPGVDLVLDVRDGLPFRNAEAIFAEHFLEHLTLQEAFGFLRECRRALAPEGVLRVSTPNLDWVYLTHYRVDSSTADSEAIRNCFDLNRAFHGYGHQFLFNRKTLASVLKSVGFARIAFHEYGKSDLPFLANLERHEKSDDIPELPHVLIAEAAGCTEPVPLPEELLSQYQIALVAR